LREQKAIECKSHGTHIAHVNAVDTVDTWHYLKPKSKIGRESFVSSWLRSPKSIKISGPRIQIKSVVVEQSSTERRKRRKVLTS